MTWGARLLGVVRSLVWYCTGWDVLYRSRRHGQMDSDKGPNSAVAESELEPRPGEAGRATVLELWMGGVKLR